MELSFKSWLEMSNTGISAGSAPAEVDDPSLKNVRQQAVRAATQAIQKGKNPVKTVQDTLLKQVQTGGIPLKKLGDVMPVDKGHAFGIK